MFDTSWVIRSAAFEMAASLEPRRWKSCQSSIPSAMLERRRLPSGRPLGPGYVNEPSPLAPPPFVLCPFPFHVALQEAR